MTFDLDKLETAIETGHRATDLLREVLKAVASLECAAITEARTSDEHDLEIDEDGEPVSCGECVVCVARRLSGR